MNDDKPTTATEKAPDPKNAATPAASSPSPMMRRYTYAGPLTSATLAGGREVTFTPGAELELPEADGYVRTLVARGRLIEAAPVSRRTKKGS